MKTLIFFASPRKSGDSAALLREVLAHLEGEYLLADACRDDIRPCVDCRRCRETSGCVIRDGMQKVYDYIPDCDNVLIVGPLYFSQLPGPQMSVFSRLQCLYSAKRFRRETLAIKPKKGGVILVGGGSGGPEGALDACEGIFRYYMQVKETFPPVLSLNTDLLPAAEDEAAIGKCRELAAFFNQPLIKE